MPVSLVSPKLGVITKQEQVQVNTAKILRIDINVEMRAIVFTIGYGYVDTDGNFVVVEKKVVNVTGNDFVALSGLQVTESDLGKNMYDLIGEKSYGYLVQNGKIEGV